MKKYISFLRKISINNDRIEKIRTWKFLPALILLMFLTNVSAQTIVSLKDKLASATSEESQRLQILVRGLPPSVYLTKGEQKDFGQGSPSVVICDAASVNLLYNDNPDFSQVELIRLTINSSGEQNVSLNLLQLKSFSKLKYVYIIFAFNICGGQKDTCIADKVIEMVQGGGSPVTVLFKLSIPE